MMRARLCRNFHGKRLISKNWLKIGDDAKNKHIAVERITPA